ncbi:oxidoreductase [Thermosulfurimonas marina]|uniref:Oxidoreductase n=1 Tax=Thermosulfurimonas marina TaxID=2047767 RepID=A0A6H1WSZ4_9BACT|nr:NAD(P)-binding domain-containing protein [Thermosulfurimonas marina]QJA06345.1 oxidoreductase [Thermosulfurimonas marina]
MEKAKIAVVGAGPAGIAVGVEARAQGISPVVIFEKAETFCDTIQRLYRPGKRVDAVFRKMRVEPLGLCSFETESKEEFLKRMEKYIQDYALDIRYKTEINGLEKTDGTYRLRAGSEWVLEAPIVVIAIGIFGKPRKPDYPIPKEVRDRVFFEAPCECPRGGKVLVVGGGDTAAETACFLCEGCEEVYLSYRRPKFFRINPVNLQNLGKKAEEGRVKLMLNTDIDHLEAAPEGVKVVFKDGREMVFDRIYYCLGGSTPAGFLRSIGVEFEDSRPKIDKYYETNLPGVFLAGDIALEKGSIMAAFNTAHIVVKRILEKYGDLVR